MFVMISEGRVASASVCFSELWYSKPGRDITGRSQYFQDKATVVYRKRVNVCRTRGARRHELLGPGLPTPVFYFLYVQSVIETFQGRRRSESNMRGRVLKKTRYFALKTVPRSSKTPKCKINYINTNARPCTISLS